MQLLPVSEYKVPTNMAVTFASTSCKTEDRRIGSIVRQEDGMRKEAGKAPGVVHSRFIFRTLRTKSTENWVQNEDA